MLLLPLLLPNLLCNNNRQHKYPCEEKYQNMHRVYNTNAMQHCVSASLCAFYIKRWRRYLPDKHCDSMTSAIWFTQHLDACTPSVVMAQRARTWQRWNAIAFQHPSIYISFVYCRSARLSLHAYFWRRKWFGTIFSLPITIQRCFLFYFVFLCDSLRFDISEICTQLERLISIVDILYKIYSFLSVFTALTYCAYVSRTNIDMYDNHVPQIGRHTVVLSVKCSRVRWCWHSTR